MNTAAPLTCPSCEKLVRSDWVDACGSCGHEWNQPEAGESAGSHFVAPAQTETPVVAEPTGLSPVKTLSIAGGVVGALIALAVVAMLLSGGINPQAPDYAASVDTTTSVASKKAATTTTAIEETDAASTPGEGDYKQVPVTDPEMIALATRVSTTLGRPATSMQLATTCPMTQNILMTRHLANAAYKKLKETAPVAGLVFEGCAKFEDYEEVSCNWTKKTDSESDTFQFTIDKDDSGKLIVSGVSTSSYSSDGGSFSFSS